MNTKTSRRTLLRLAPLSLLPIAVDAAETAVPDTFPAQPTELAREMVTVSHFDLKRVKELVKAHPALAKAAWDWGFGDWETALGAASHTGKREIAEVLIGEGAHPTIFSAAMFGQLEVVKTFVAAQPGVQRIAGPHSISLLAHARMGGSAAEPVLKYLESLGDADGPASVPLSEDAMKALVGTYAFGTNPNQRIEITMPKNGLLFTRTGTIGRGLVHVGDRAFHPAGAAAVRIRFEGEGADLRLVVHDPGPVVTARRIP